ncbi:MAG: hypothetical protein GXO99_02320 [Nitrospirae bacterium]|nr:hypothetical protein [Nitrospirota bacterium]
MKMVKLTFRLFILLVLIIQVVLPFYIVVPSVNGLNEISKPDSPVLTLDVCSVKGKLIGFLSLMLPAGIFILVTVLLILYHLFLEKPFLLPCANPEIFHPPTF